MKLIIAGSRNINDIKIVEESVMEFVEDTNLHITEIVSGMARGVDTLGKQYANENNIYLKEFPANWNLYGKKAGFLRNEQMGDYADVIIAVWNGTSNGTRHMIKYMLKLNKPVYIKLIDNDGNILPLLKVTKKTNLDNLKSSIYNENII